MTVIQPYWTTALPESFYYPNGQSTNPWDYVLLNAGAGWKRIPGVCKVDVSSSIKLDKKQAAGRQFATITTEGYVPCDVVIEVLLISPGDWLAWQTDIAPIGRPQPGSAFSKNPKVMTIIHPATQAADIEGVTWENVHGPKMGHLPGTREYTIECVQWTPANQSKASVTETPKGIITVPTNPNSVLAPKNKPSSGAVPTKAAP